MEGNEKPVCPSCNNSDFTAYYCQACGKLWLGKVSIEKPDLFQGQLDEARRSAYQDGYINGQRKGHHGSFWWAWGSVMFGVLLSKLFFR